MNRAKHWHTFLWQDVNTELQYYIIVTINRARHWHTFLWRDVNTELQYYIILHKWFVTSNLIGWLRSHGCSAFSDIARWIASFWICDVSDVGDVEDVRNGVDCTENMGRTELGADRMWGELAWGEPALGRNGWKHNFRTVVARRRPWKNLLLNSSLQRGSCTRKPLCWHIYRGFSVTCRPIVKLLSSISSNPTGFSKVRGKHEFLLSIFILFTLVTVQWKR